MCRRPLEMSLRLQKALQVLFVVVAVIVFSVVVVAALVFRCCFCHSACSLLFFSSLATGRMRNMPALLHMRVCTSVCCQNEVIFWRRHRHLPLDVCYGDDYE